mmetsp:Transcript_44563/g.80091  ORF Transcript_44563/g.80091 Transcript_44563/m.80091 type:complete len:600 (-) Transcript_44563:121-1920(-)
MIRANESLEEDAACTMLLELLERYRREDFQQRLDCLIQEASRCSRSTGPPAHVPGRRELVFAEQCQVLPNYGFAASEEGLAQMSKAVQRLMDSYRIRIQVHLIREALRIPAEDGRPGLLQRPLKTAAQGQDEAEDESESSGGETLSKKRAVAMLQEVLAAFNSAAFQKKLHEILRKAETSRTQLFGRAFWSHVTRAQADILARHGFEGSEGLQHMMAALEPLRQDADVKVLCNSIEELLFNVPYASPRGKGRTHMETRREVLALLREQLAYFSSPEFKQEVEQRRSRCGDTGEKALIAQEKILPKYGYEGNRRGVSEMVDFCSQYMEDPEVLFLHTSCQRLVGRERAQTAPEPERPAPKPTLTNKRAKTLLSELLIRCSEPNVQKKLKALIEAAPQSSAILLAEVPGREALMLSLQKEVIPKYGFEDDSQGVVDMKNALKPWLQDESVAAKVEAVHQKLRMPPACPGSLMHESTGLDISEGSSRLGKESTISLQKELLAAYQSEDFQNSIARAQRTSGDLSLQMAREIKELVRSAQMEILPRYGFQVSDQGVREMVAHIESFKNDPDVSVLSQAIDEALFGGIIPLAQSSMGRSRANTA